MGWRADEAVAVSGQPQSVGHLSPIADTAVLTAAEMRAAEAAAVADGIEPAELMRRAGEGVAETVRRLAAGADTLIVCGPGNNGGDGYVAAATLARAGHPVRVAAIGEPKTELCAAARAQWQGPVEALGLGVDAPMVIDAVFGTGLSRPFPQKWGFAFSALVRNARLSIAVDLPSGVMADDGVWPSPSAIPGIDLTLALGAVKPAHLLQPAASRCGEVRLLSLGLAASSDVRVLGRPRHLTPPAADANKFTRGMVAVVPGPMAGAAILAGEAAMRAGAGYVILFDGGSGAPHAMVRRSWSPDALADRRIGAVLIGNGLGRDGEARARLDTALAAGKPLVIDGDALHLVDPDRLAAIGGPVILTPHEGEFEALFSTLPGSKIDRAREAARRSGATVVYKGADTVIADAGGEHVTLAGGGSPWLSTAGSGDVLAGATAAMLASGLSAYAAAKAAVWLHGDAARRCGAAFVADDLAAALSAARAGL